MAPTPFCYRLAFTAFVSLAAAGVLPAKPPPPAGRIGQTLNIADFEGGVLDAAVLAPGAKLDLLENDATASPDDHMLRVVLGGGGDAEAADDALNEHGVTFPLGGLVIPLDGQFKFTARLEAEKLGEVPLRWLALDDRGRTVRQAKLKLNTGETWTELSIPLHSWRWGNDAVGAWADVKHLRVVVEGPAGALFLDDIAVLPADAEQARAPQPSPASPGEQAEESPPPVTWLKGLAFPERPGRVVEAGGLLVATDVPADTISDADLHRLLAKMGRARALVRRVFGDAVRPIDDATPPALIVFAGPGGVRGFWERAGREWSANVVPPGSEGYTVYDIATSSFDPAKGAERPVFLHESVHAIVAHDVRLLSGTERHAWLQEGIATYVQLSAYPQSLAPGSYARAFAAGVAPPGGKQLFVPLDGLLGRRVTPRNYAQLASLVAFLIERQPTWLPKIARALADGEEIGVALSACGTDAAALEAAWLAWGRERFAQRGAEAQVHFEAPPEFDEDAR